MALTRITKGVIKPNENYDTHNINSTGIITAVGANFTGNVSVGGVLTYEDVSSIDAVGIITANQGIHVGAGVSAVGVGTFSGLDISGDIDVDGHTNLDNVSIAGVTTTSDNIIIPDNKKLILGSVSGRQLEIYHNTSGSSNHRIESTSSSNHLIFSAPVINPRADYFSFRNKAHNQNVFQIDADNTTKLYFNGNEKLTTENTGVNITGIVTATSADINGDLDVDGHTELDNVNIAGVTTFSDNDIHFKNNGITSCRFDSNRGAFEFNHSGGLFWYKNGNLSNSSGATIFYSEFANQYKGLVIQAPWQGQNNAKNVTVMGSSNGRFNVQNNLNAQETFSAYFQGGVHLGYYQSGNKLSTTQTGITLNQDLTVNRNALITGISTFTGAIDANGDLDVDGHTNLDNVSIAGVTTASGNISVIKSSGTATISVQSADNYATLEIGGQVGAFIDLKSPASDDYDIRYTHDGFIYAKTNINLSPQAGYVVNVNKKLNCAEDLDVDGHTNLDNVSVAGVSTFTGRIDASDNIAITSGNRLYFGNSDVAFIKGEHGGSAYLALGANTEHLRITRAGQVLIGGTSNSASSHADELQIINTSAQGGLSIINASNGQGNIYFGHSGGTADGRIEYSHQADYMRFFTANNERLRIISDGKVLIGDGSTYTPNGMLHIVGDNNSNGPELYLQVNNNNTTDNIGALIFGNNVDKSVVKIQGVTHTANNTGDLTFHTSTTGTMTEKLRITSGGEVNIGGNYTQTTAPLSVTTGANDYGIRLQTGSNVVCEILNNDSAGNSEIRGYYNNNSGTRGEGYRLEANGETFFNPGGTSGLSITTGGIVKIGGSIENNADIDTSNTKLTIKQSANAKEDGIYLERSGERRGWYMFVGGNGGYNDAFCLSTNQMGTDTDVLAIDRGNRLAKLGGDVIIDSSNNGYGGLRIYDDSSGDYNVRYITGRNQGLTAHVFERGGRTQNQSPWSNVTSSEIARLTHTNGISFRGEGTTNIGSYASHHLRVKTNDKERIHIDNRGVLTAPKLNTKALVFSSCTNKWASQRSVLRFYMDFYTGASSATYHFMRMISQPDWAFDDVTIKQIRYQYSPDSGDHATKRYYTYYGNHYEDIINYNQRGGTSSGTSASNWITKRTDFGPGGAHKIHEAANGGYYRDLWGSDYSIGLGNYIGVRLEITVYNTVGVYDTGTYATASDFYPAAFGGQATQSDADNHGGPRGVWFNTVANGTGSGSAPVLGIHQNNAYGWNTGSNFFDTSL